MDDPRADLAEDTAQGARLLSAAWGRDRETAWVLNGVRCLGARLQDGRIVPGEEYDPAEWEAHRARWLLPRAATIRELLSEVMTNGATTSDGGSRQGSAVPAGVPARVAIGDPGA